MNGANENREGLSNGRSWAALPTQGSALEWSVDSKLGLIQGPLDLEFMRGKRMLLSLDQGQYALLVGDNSLQAVYLEGGHQLEIGKSKSQIPTTSSLIFLAANHSIQLRWTKLDPVDWNNKFNLGTIGHCSLFIDAPALFYRSFLEKTTSWDDQAIYQAIDGVTRAALSSALESTFPDGEASEVEIQSKLMYLGVEEVAEGLSAYGLNCSQLAVYTAAPPVEQDANERAGQLPGLVHN